MRKFYQGQQEIPSTPFFITWWKTCTFKGGDENLTKQSALIEDWFCHMDAIIKLNQKNQNKLMLGT